MAVQQQQPAEFLSTPSVGRATSVALLATGQVNYFYPRPPWGGRRRAPAQHQAVVVISIHALRGEGDVCHAGWAFDREDFYPRPPWGGRPAPRSRPAKACYFYPRPPWGGRPAPLFGAGQINVISIHALRGEGDQACAVLGMSLTISIHALRGEGDPRFPARSTHRSRFLSTPSVGRATIFSPLSRRCTRISIHALRGEGDNLP